MHFRTQLSELQFDFVKEIRGKGLMNALELDTERLLPAQNAWALCLLLKQNGLLAKPTHENIIRFSPPLCINREEMDCAVEIIKKSLAQFADAA